MLFYLVQKSYLTEAHRICSGEPYEVGCGTGDGTLVMNVTRILVLMDAESQAFQCSAFGTCNLELTQGRVTKIL